MSIKVFFPDLVNNPTKKYCVPPLLSVIAKDFYEAKQSPDISSNEVIIVAGTIEDCDIVMPTYYINYYSDNGKFKELKAMNNLAISFSKQTVCWTIGDWGITPKLRNFYLYRLSGYKSKNKGNEYGSPFMLNYDPVERYLGGRVPLNIYKPKVAVIGFCGRATANPIPLAADVLKEVRRLFLKQIGKWHEDIDLFKFSAYKRFKILQKLKQSKKIEANFILYHNFFGGQVKKEGKQKAAQRYFENIKNSHYVFCYRGWGNFSIRLYEALACGRIPIIIDTDINLPFEDEIDWQMFPFFKEAELKDLDEKIAAFHTNLSETTFVQLQLKARKIWEDYCTASGFIQKFSARHKNLCL